MYQQPYQQQQIRPTGITIIAILFFIGGALNVLGGLMTLFVAIPALDPITSLIASYQIAGGLFLILVGGLQVAVGWGLWTLQDWARVTAIVLYALGAIVYLVGGIALLVGVTIQGFRITYPGPGVGMLLLGGLYCFLIWYLTKPEVTGAFMGGGYAPPTFPMPPAPVGPTVPAPPPGPTAVAPPFPAPRPTQAPAPPPPQTELVGAPAQAEGWLVARSGAHSGQSFGLKRGNNTVGRDPRKADVVVDDSTVSGEHARVKYEGGQFYLYDLASTNGSFINNRRVQRQLLMDSDIVRFGNVELVFKKV